MAASSGIVTLCGDIAVDSKYYFFVDASTVAASSGSDASDIANLIEVENYVHVVPPEYRQIVLYADSLEREQLLRNC